jgi:hypothetical protein
MARLNELGELQSQRGQIQDGHADLLGAVFDASGKDRCQVVLNFILGGL